MEVDGDTDSGAVISVGIDSSIKCSFIAGSIVAVFADFEWCFEDFFAICYRLLNFISLS
jgi:hypothetical protein